MDVKKILCVAFSMAILVSFPSCSKKTPAEDKTNILEEQTVLIEENKEDIPEIPQESAEPLESEESPQDPINDLKDLTQLSEEFKYLEGLDTQAIPWGPGTNFGDDKRPIACNQLQEKYGEYDADFVRNSEIDNGKIFLTFDEGYENGYTGSILDTLKEKEVSAVFFVTLPYVKSCPDLVKRMIDEGHIVGNHTAGHPNMTTITAEEGYEDVAKLHKYMEENFGYSMFLYRPPEGAFSLQNLGLLKSMGYRTVFWSYAYKDWDANDQMAPSEAFERVTKHLHDGEIMLLHAVSSTNDEILGDVIDYIRDSGYTLERYTVGMCH